MQKKYKRFPISFQLFIDTFFQYLAYYASYAFCLQSFLVINEVEKLRTNSITFITMVKAEQTRPPSLRRQSL